MTPRRAVRAAFPGSGPVWLGALLVALVFAVVVGRQLFARPAPLTGTNSVDVAAVIATAKAGQQTCVRDLVVPAGTHDVQVFFGFPSTNGRPAPMGGTLVAGTDRWTVSLPAATAIGGLQTLALDHAPAHDTPPGTLCLRAPVAVDYGGASVQRLPGAPVSTVGGRPLASVDVSVRYLSTTGKPSLRISRLRAALKRAALFKDYWGGSLLLWLVLAGFVAVAYLVVRTAATVEGRSARSLARRAYVVALFAGCAWALMMPPFYGADESEHFAYVQQVAATGHRADSSPTARPPYSSDEAALLGGLHHNSSILNSTARPRWSKAYDRAYARAERANPSDSNGGGFTDSASGHSPLYYTVMAVPYKALNWALSLPRLVVAIRLFNAALAALVAALAVLCAAALFPRLPGVWWVAGCLAALQPVFDSVAGTINNDTLVNMLAALSLYLLMDAWRSGPRRARMAALGVATALLPLAKVTGFALWPVVAFGVLVVLAKHRTRPALLSAAWTPGTALGALVVWLGAGGHLVNGHTAEQVATVPAAAPGAPAAVGVTFFNKISYLVQEVVPFIHLTGDYWIQTWPLYSVYIERGFGRFGWLNAGLQNWVIHLVLGALIVGWALVLAAAWRARRTWREWAGGVAMLALAVVAVLTLVGFAYATLAPRPVVGEQGRYIFPALVPLAVLMAGGATALRGRLRPAYYGIATSGIALLAGSAWLSALGAWFT